MSVPSSSTYGWPTLTKVLAGVLSMLLAIDFGLKLVLGSPRT